jgi:uncharacterized membrane protein (UPF0127 family)
MTKTVTVLGDGAVVCERCELADGVWTRLRGLIGRAGLEPGAGLMLRPAWAIHTSFMRFPIDAVFLDEELRVLRVREGLRPWRAAVAPGAAAVLELPAGEAARIGVAPGARLGLETPSPAPSPSRPTSTTPREES